MSQDSSLPGQTLRDVAALYVEYRPFLIVVAARKFRVPDEDCEAILQDAFLAFIGTDGEVENPRAWLIATVCNLCRYYWRMRARFDDLESTDTGHFSLRADALAVERLERQLLARRVLAALGEQDRRVLRLHYYERLTAAEIAERLGTTPGYAEKLIVKALRRARRIFTTVHNDPTDRQKHTALRHPTLAIPIQKRGWEPR